MTIALRTSGRRAYKVLPFAEAAEQAQQLEGAERDRFRRDQAAPPDVRRRKREARRWLNLLTVVSSDPSYSERRPGDGWFTLAEKKTIWFRAHHQLRETDPELYRAVERVHWDDSVRNEGITVEEMARDGRAPVARA
jgi:hypothetical protein